jgi:hypothetical protein
MRRTEHRGCGWEHNTQKDATGGGRALLLAAAAARRIGEALTVFADS